jgi:hypothetical protein
MPGTATQCDSRAGKRRFGHPAMGIQHADGIGAPGFAQAGHGFQGPRKPGIPHGEVLRAMVKAAKGRTARGHATAGRDGLLEHGDAVASLHQRARAGHAGHAGTDHGEMPGALGCCCHGSLSDCC